MQEVKGIPNRVAAENDNRGRTCDDPNERGKSEAYGYSEELRPESILRFLSESSKVWIVYNQGSKVRNRTHDTFDHGPAKSTTRSCTRLVNNWPNTMCSDDAPDEESYSAGRNHKSFHCKQVSNGLNVRIDGR